MPSPSLQPPFPPRICGGGAGPSHACCCCCCRCRRCPLTGGGAPTQVPPPAGQPGGGPFGALRMRALRLQRFRQQLRTETSKRPPTTLAMAMTRVRLLEIQLVISLLTVAPVHWPLLHLPPPAHEVPSRKFCCME